MFPKEFGRYIEIFGGSGAVLLGKEPSKFEVYNDIEGELVNKHFPSATEQADLARHALKFRICPGQNPPVRV